jgi:hypothetical protein
MNVIGRFGESVERNIPVEYHANTVHVPSIQSVFILAIESNNFFSNGV